MPRVQWHVSRTQVNPVDAAYSIEEVESEVLLFVNNKALGLEEIVYLSERVVIQVTNVLGGLIGRWPVRVVRRL
jgi:hypothetical protein